MASDGIAPNVVEISGHDIDYFYDSKNKFSMTRLNQHG